MLAALRRSGIALETQSSLVFLASVRKDHRRTMMITVRMKALNEGHPVLSGRLRLPDSVAYTYLGVCVLYSKEAEASL